ncbi:hypothetical protein [Marivirga sp.]|uniref:hypothetical protein n=1 Tax=Marivirga sp. TaxID=2018662 RepID=UPI002D7FF2D4|nr:hypothetical protein [Marivirga sp.]HET8861309.1 hypothetical protein [Marivirga sp.]
MQYNIKNKARHLIFYSTIILGFLLILTGCPTPPEFDEVPIIQFQDVQVGQRTDTSSSGQPLNQDVISLTITFEDGDGNLGLGSNELGPPYQLFDIPLDENGELIKFGSNPNLPPYNFYDYFIVEDSLEINNTILVDDTLFVLFNERHFNIYVNFFYQEPGEEFKQFEWGRTSPFYQPFHGRFPMLNTEDYDRPLNGSLTYDVVSTGFGRTFLDYPMYIETYIIDRAGNKSNVVRTETFRFLNPG